MSTQLIDYIRENKNILTEDSDCPFYSKEEISAKIDECVAIDAQDVYNHWQQSPEKWSIPNLLTPKPPFPSIFINYVPEMYFDGIKKEELEYQTLHKGIFHRGTLVLSGSGNKKVNNILFVGFGGLKILNDNNIRILNGKSLKPNHFYDVKVSYKATMQLGKDGTPLLRFKENDILSKVKRFFFNSKTKDKNDYGYYEEIYDLPELSRLNDNEKIKNELESKQKMVGINKDLEKSIVGAASEDVLISLLTCSFMNCKNIELKIMREGRTVLKNVPSEIFKPRNFIYTLDVYPIKKIINRISNGQNSFSPKRLHQVRGHFKDFTHGQGLFGLHKGTYWWPNAVRGQKERGQVIKSYRPHH